MTLQQMVIERIALLGCTKAEYARRVGIEPQHLNEIVKGKTTLPRRPPRRGPGIGAGQLQVYGLVLSRGGIFLALPPLANSEGSNMRKAHIAIMHPAHREDAGTVADPVRAARDAEARTPDPGAYTPPLLRWRAGSGYLRRRDVVLTYERVGVRAPRGNG